jgi:hypothetical protein
VFVTNPNTCHVPVALAAARAGCHLFIEKPLSHSLEGVAELIEIVESRHLVAFVAYQFRFHPGLRALKSLIDAGRLGRLAAAHIVNGEYLPDWHPYEDYRQTHPARRDLGGGALRIQTHELDYALWLLGMPARVYAVGGHLSRLEIDVEDSVSLLLTCEHDGRPVPVHVHLDYLQRPPQRVCEIVGDAGKVRFDYYAKRVECHDTTTGRVSVECFVARGMRMFREHCDDSKIHFFKNLAADVYIALMRRCCCIVGNSSSAIREGAFIGTPAVNIGTRQAMRQRGPNVADVDYNREQISDAIVQQMRHGPYANAPIYGDGHAGDRIADVLSRCSWRLQKRITY